MMEYVYFRTYAKEIGCKNVDELGDLAIWNYILVYQGKQPIVVGADHDE